MCALSALNIRWVWLATLPVLGCVAVVEGQDPSVPVSPAGELGDAALQPGPTGSEEAKRAVEDRLIKRRGGAGSPFQEGDYLVAMLDSNWTPWPRYQATPTPQLIQRMGSRDSRDRQGKYGLMVDGYVYEGATGARTLMRQWAEEDARLAAAIWLALTTEADKPIVGHAQCADPLWQGETLVFCAEQSTGSIQRFEVDLNPPPSRRRGAVTGVRVRPVDVLGEAE